jgi:hypothetical protein
LKPNIDVFAFFAFVDAVLEFDISSGVRSGSAGDTVVAVAATVEFVRRVDGAGAAFAPEDEGALRRLFGEVLPLFIVELLCQLEE